MYPLQLHPTLRDVSPPSLDPSEVEEVSSTLFLTFFSKKENRFSVVAVPESFFMRYNSHSVKREIPHQKRPGTVTGTENAISRIPSGVVHDRGKSGGHLAMIL